jgi:hypothetical protein
VVSLNRSRAQNSPLANRRGTRCIAIALTFAVASTGCGGNPEPAITLEDIDGLSLTLEQSAALWDSTQVLTAACMEERGWQYVPIPAPPDPPSVAVLEDPAAGTRFGYGVVARFRLDVVPTFGLSNDPFAVADPNYDYLQSLGEDERERYRMALYGTGEARSPESQGCSEISRAESGAAGPLADPAVAERYNALMSSRESDAAISPARAAWQRCVDASNPNLGFTEPEDGAAYIGRLLAEAQGLRAVPADPDTLLPLDPTESTNVVDSFVDEAGGTFVFVGSPTVVPDAELDALQGEEIRVWSIDRRCRDDSGYDRAHAQFDQRVAESLLEEFPQLRKGD